MPSTFTPTILQKVRSIRTDQLKYLTINELACYKALNPDAVLPTELIPAINMANYLDPTAQTGDTKDTGWFGQLTPSGVDALIPDGGVPTDKLDPSFVSSLLTESEFGNTTIYSDRQVFLHTRDVNMDQSNSSSAAVNWNNGERGSTKGAGDFPVYSTGCNDLVVFYCCPRITCNYYSNTITRGVILTFNMYFRETKDGEKKYPHQSFSIRFDELSAGNKVRSRKFMRCQFNPTPLNATQTYYVGFDISSINDSSVSDMNCDITVEFESVGFPSNRVIYDKWKQ
jgi:hypothetical protein